MRVQLTRRTHDERGAIAIIAALMMTVVMLLAAFALDFGMAYNSKQRLQVAADAGALAALQVYKGNSGKCGELISDTPANAALREEAQAAAELLATQNVLDYTEDAVVNTPITITCPTDDALSVSYAVAGTTGTSFGALAGVESITTAPESQATIGDATLEVGGMRPWGICSNVATTSGTVVFAPLKDGSTVQDGDHVCGTQGPPGGWWVEECTGQGQGTGATEAAVLDGCAATDYQAVPGQPVDPTPTELHDFLTAACPFKTANDTCLQSDQGKNFSKHTGDEWQTLVGTMFTMPGICTTPQCSELAVDGQGSKASYAIHRMLTVELCGFRMGNTSSTDWPTAGPCATANPKGYKPADIDEGDGFFVVVHAINGGNVSWTLNNFSDMRLTQ